MLTQMNEVKNILSKLFWTSLIGGMIGTIDFIFGQGLLYLSSFREQHILWLLPWLPLAGLVIIWLGKTFSQEVTKGMGLIFEVGHRERKSISLLLIPFSIVSTWLTHLFGGSAGREGVAVQLGGTIGQFVSRIRQKEGETSYWLVIGMAAGFAGLFQTPIAATFFALEVLYVGKLIYEVLPYALLASFISAKVTHFLGLEKFVAPIHSLPKWNSSLFLKLCLAGLLFGIIGWLFSNLLLKAKQWAKVTFPNPTKRILIMGAGTALLLASLYYGRYSGLGTHLISESFNHGTIYSTDWLLKLLLTILTLAAGFQGGEVTPLFSIGASFGFLLGTWLGLPTPFLAALGYSSVFAAATNTYLGPLFIGVEVFGPGILPYLLLTLTVSFAINKNQSIYTGQKINTFYS
ncbi:chloride channel protein [Vagococcus humatus]|uniref:Voltage-gated chloride channel protein n=1 Tax=Vagococcus humatus TaxID=1889241 RepID=A0A429Z9D4_9ENTE|nr:chloride channel protein [Vagococcus humatus]RST90293.1 voltage-gated chloride channel protein [Vagococcus humatus]